MDEITHEMRLCHWAALIQECCESGLSKKDWMIQNSINEKQFYYWQRRVREEVFHELPTKDLSKQISFAELPAYRAYDPINQSASAVLHIGSCMVELNDTISSELLERILRVASHAE